MSAERRLIVHRELFPSFGIMERDQEPVARYTVLSINISVKDCAAYEGIGPVMNADPTAHPEVTDAYDAFIERVRAGGAKISEHRAKELFDEIEDEGLRYRP